MSNLVVKSWVYKVVGFLSRASVEVFFHPKNKLVLVQDYGGVAFVCFHDEHMRVSAEVFPCVLDVLIDVCG